jgi:hypothetical protein
MRLVRRPSPANLRHIAHNCQAVELSLAEVTAFDPPVVWECRRRKTEGLRALGASDQGRFNYSRRQQL